MVHVEVDPFLLQKYTNSLDLTNFPKRWKADFDTWSKQEKENWYLGRFKCLKSHLYLSGFIETEPDDFNSTLKHQPILGMDFQDDPHSLLFQQYIQKRPGEGLVLSDLDTVIKKRMVLWPRGVFKTSSAIVEMIQLILNYPNIRICFLTGGDQLAKLQLRRLKQYFEKPSALFLELFPEFCLKSVENKKVKNEASPDRWKDVLCKLGNAHEFTVPCRTNFTFAEPTFAISTAKSVKAGSHYDVIFIDDLVNETNYRSVKLLEKVYEDYLAICPLLEPTGFIIMTGTRYSFGDTYERIQELAKEEEKKIGRTIWRFSIEDCWVYGCKNCPHTDVYHDFRINAIQPPCSVEGCKCVGYQTNNSKGVLFPSVRVHDGREIGETLERLEAKKRELGEEFFANQYENNPIAQGSQTFTEALLGAQTLHHMSQIPAYDQSYTFGVGDLAYVGQEDKDFSVIYMCRLFRGQIFIYACEYGNWDSGAVADQTISILLTHRPAVLFYEKINGWDGFNRLITAAANTKGIQKVPIIWDKYGQAKDQKKIRIGSIKGVLTARRLWFYAGMKGYDQLVKQLVKWPKLGRHDDFADCAGQVVTVPSGYEGQTPPNSPSSNDWRKKYLGGGDCVHGIPRSYCPECSGDGGGNTDMGAGSGISCG
jgi:hypothetical protein